VKPLASLLVLAASCSATAKPEPPPSTAPVPAAPAGDAAAPAVTRPCPAGAELEQLARDQWGIARGGKLEVECAEGRFGEPAWVIWGLAYDVPMGDADGDEPGGAVAELDNQLHTTIVTPAGDVIARSDEGGLSFVDLDYGETPSYRPHDLDGDGVDELVTILSSSRRGYFVRELVLTVIADGALEPSGERLFVSYDDGGAVAEPPGPTSCPGTVRFDATQIVIESGAPTGDPEVIESACAPAGERRYALRDRALVPVD
jgi:hypothetical protein